MVDLWFRITTTVIASVFLLAFLAVLWIETSHRGEGIRRGRSDSQVKR